MLSGGSIAAPDARQAASRAPDDGSLLTDINLADETGKTPLDYALRFPAPDHETPTNNGALEYLLDDHLPVFWKRLYALTFARVPGHAVVGDEYLARHLGSFLVGDDLLTKN